MAGCFDKKKRDRYLGAIRQGCMLTEAAKYAGVTRQCVWDYTQKHPEFKELVDVAEADACGPIERRLYEKALEGNMTAILFWLYNRSLGRWQDKRNVVISTPDTPLYDKEAIKKAVEETDRLSLEFGTTVRGRNTTPPAPAPAATNGHAGGTGAKQDHSADAGAAR